MVWREMLHAIEFAYYLFNQYPLNIKHRENRKENFPSCFCQFRFFQQIAIFSEVSVGF